LKLVGPAGGQTLQARALVPLIKSMLDFQYARPDFAYRYYADGLLAERVDKRGVAIRYYYDDQRRLSAQEVWHYERSVTPQHDVIPVGTWLPDLQPTDRNIWQLGTYLKSYTTNQSQDIPYAVPGYPGWMGIPNSPNGFDHPVDRIGFISYAYDSRGNLERVTAGTSRAAVNAAPPAIVAETKYLYDDRNNLIKEFQSHGGSADVAGVPFIEYTRQYTSGASSALAFSPGRDRLLSMTYPGHAGYSGPRTVTFDYGDATGGGGLDALVDRPSSYNMGTSRIAGFTYTGSGRRVATALGGTATTPWVRQSFDTNPNTHALEGLDALGRVKDVHYRNTATNPATLWRGQYGYD
ncbi:MAG: hypothetical protein ACK58T_26935, partial [Phycisphaerae bacterium]